MYLYKDLELEMKENDIKKLKNKIEGLKIIKNIDKFQFLVADEGKKIELMLKEDDIYSCNETFSIENEEIHETLKEVIRKRNSTATIIEYIDGLMMEYKYKNGIIEKISKIENGKRHLLYDVNLLFFIHKNKTKEEEEQEEIDRLNCDIDLLLETRNEKNKLAIDNMIKENINKIFLTKKDMIND